MLGLFSAFTLPYVLGPASPEMMGPYMQRTFSGNNDPTNATAFLRQPQFEALEIYVFLKEFLDNAAVHAIDQDWSQQSGRFKQCSPLSSLLVQCRSGSP